MSFRFGLSFHGRTLALVAALMSAAIISTPAAAGVTGRHGASKALVNPAVSPTVLLPLAQLNGYSLRQANQATAVYNLTTDGNGHHIGPPPSPFDGQPPHNMLMLRTTDTNVFTVKQGTAFFIPVFALTPDGFASFPDVNNQASVLDYVFSASKFGVQTATLTITDVRNNQTQLFQLDERYVTASYVRPVPDGSTSYVAISAFVRSLPVGEYRIKIAFSLNGALAGPFDSTPIVYTVHVRGD